MSWRKKKPSLWSLNTRKRPGSSSHPPRNGRTVATTGTNATARIATAARDTVRLRGGRDRLAGVHQKTRIDFTCGLNSLSLLLFPSRRPAPGLQQPGLRAAAVLGATWKQRREYSFDFVDRHTARRSDWIWPFDLPFESFLRTESNRGVGWP